MSVKIKYAEYPIAVKPRILKNMAAEIRIESRIKPAPASIKPNRRRRNGFFPVAAYAL